MYLKVGNNFNFSFVYLSFTDLMKISLNMIGFKLHRDCIIKIRYVAFNWQQEYVLHNGIDNNAAFILFPFMRRMCSGFRKSKK